MASFNAYAKYYDLFYSDKEYVQESEYIQNIILANEERKTEKLLDVGCGTGKHLEKLIDNYQCTGVDLSKEMISIAQKRLGDKVNFLEGSSEDLPFKDEFDVVTALFHVASYWSNDELAESSFKSVHEAMKPGGLFVLDYWYGPAVDYLKPENRIHEKENENFRVIKNVKSTWMKELHQVQVDYDIRLSETNGAKHSFQETHLMRYYWESDIEEMAQKAGFIILEHKAWLSEKVPHKESWAAVSVLKKV